MPTRRHQRVPLQRTIGLKKSGQAGDSHPGITINFSPDGCSVHHNTPSLHCGMRVKLRLALPDGAESVNIDQAIITWAQKDQCGIRFMALTPDDQSRIMMVYDALLEAQAGDTESNTPPVISLEPISEDVY